MAPELLRTRKVTMQSNVYSFGILAVEVTCDRIPLHIEEHSKVQMVIMLDMVWVAQEQTIRAFLWIESLGTRGASFITHEYTQVHKSSTFLNFYVLHI
jgi:hypothetical protein